MQDNHIILQNTISEECRCSSKRQLKKKMRTPFTKAEVATAIKRLKNNKSPGVDEVIAELFKYAPDLVHKQIVEIYNEMAATGEYPIEITQGLLCAIQKPGKTIGPPQNLHPIILLSILRKILSVCLMERIGKHIDNEIPPSQAAYRNGSTSKHVFSKKLIIERTITSSSETVYLTLHDI